jgi:hypothetical protein
MNPQDSLKEQVEKQQVQIDMLKSEINLLKQSNTIPLNVYQAFVDRFFSNSIFRGNVGINGNDYGGGDKVIYIANSNIAPPNTPGLGGVLFTAAGALKYKGSSGTITTIANA